MSPPPSCVLVLTESAAAGSIVDVLQRAGHAAAALTPAELAASPEPPACDVLIAAGASSRTGIAAWTEQLCARVPDTPVVVLLQDGGAEAALAALRAGARAALLPGEHPQLPETVACLLRERLTLRQAAAEREALREALAREQQATARMRAVGAILDAALARADDASGVYQELVERIATLLEVDAVSVRLPDDDGRLRVCAAHNIPHEFWENFAPMPGEATTGRAMAEGRTVIVRDLWEWPPASPTLRRFREVVGARSMLAAPITVEGRIMGVINILSRRIRDFTADEVHLVETAAARVAAVAVQAQLVRATREALATRDQALAIAEAERDRLRQVIEVLPEGIAIVGADGQVVLSNAAAASILGQPPTRADAAGEGAIAPRHASGYRSRSAEMPLARTLAEGVVVQGEQMTVWNAAEQRAVTLLASSAPLHGPDGSVTGAVAVFQDMTAIKQAEEHLLREKRFSDSVIDSLPGVFYLFDAHGRFLRWNTNFERVTGYTAAEIATMHPRDFFRGDDVALIESRIRDVFVHGQADAEADFVAKDGSTHPYYFTGLRIELDGVPYLVGTGIDITERRRAEAAVRRNEERFRALVQNTSDAIVVLDAKGMVAYISPPIERMLGRKPEEIIGTTPFYLVHPDDVERLKRTSQQMLKTAGLHGPVEYRLQHANGSWRTIEITANNLLDDPLVEGVVQVLRDVTERHQAEQERAELLAREQAARAEAERAAARAARLQAVTAALTEAVTPSDVIHAALTQALEALGAVAGVVLLLSDDGQTLQPAGSFGYPNGYLAGQRHVPVSGGTPASDAVRTGDLVVVESMAERVARYPLLAQPAVPVGFEAMAALPLVTEGRVIGAINISFRGPHSFDDAERNLLLSIGRQCALALERARLFDAERAARAESEAARQRLALLSEASELLNASLEYEPTLRNVARIAIPRFADWCNVYILGDDGRLRVLEVAHHDPDQEAALRELVRAYPPDLSRADHPVQQAMQRGVPVLLPAVTDEWRQQIAQDARHLELMRRMQTTSTLVAPLIARERVLGVISFGRGGTERRYTEADGYLAGELARRAAAAIERARLYEAEQAARAEAETAKHRLEVLAEASELLNASLEYEPTLRQVVRLAIPRLADWCTVYVVDAEGSPPAFEVAHVDPEKEALMRELQHAYPVDFSREGHPVIQAMRSRRSVLLAEITDTFRESFAKDARHLALIRALASRSAVIAPLLVGERVLGAISFGVVANRPPYSMADLRLAEELAARAAVAIERASLYEAQRVARAEAEAERRRLAFLAEASVILAGSLDYTATFDQLARLVVPALASWCIVDVVDDDGAIRSLGVAHADPEKEPVLRALRRRYSPDRNAHTPVARVLRSGRSLLAPVGPSNTPEALAQDAEHLALLRALTTEPIAVMIVPLVTRGRTVGAISFGSEPGKDYTPADLALAEELARRAAAAMDNARLYRETVDLFMRERRLSERLRQLATCVLNMTSARTLDEALRTVVQNAREIIGAEAAILTLASDEEPIVSRSVQGARGGVQAMFAGAAAIAAVLRAEGLPPRMTRTELDTRLVSVPSAVAGALLPERGLLVMPLSGREGQPLGAVQLWDSTEGGFTEEDEAIMVQLAQFASVAIENEKLQQQAAAAAAAVEADRLKGELLATVSHELRTPLAAIKGFTTTMLSYFDRLDREEQHSFLAEIDGAADRLHELVENLLRLSRLEAGTLDFRRERADPVPLLERALEDARRRYQDRVITLEIEGALPAISIDTRRIAQVIANLIDNAVKYSPDGGEVEVRARPRADSGLEISVTDHGIGIPPEHLDRIFERFHRVDNSATREIGGTGLGLAICKRIVEQHGGQITVQSREGEGSTFTVMLPAA